MMSALRAIGMAIAFTSVVGCAPSFEDIGAFACANDGTCPAGFFCKEKLCKKGAEETPDASDLDSTVKSTEDAQSYVDAGSDALISSDALQDVSARPSIVASRVNGLYTSEYGQHDSVYVYLSSQPTGPVTLGISVFPLTEVALESSPTLVYNPSNWQTLQAITVKGLHDYQVDGDQKFSIRVFVDTTDDGDYKTALPVTIYGTNVDVDQAALVIEPASSVKVTEGAQVKFTLRPDTKPLDTVTFVLTSSDTGIATVSPSTVDYEPADWGTAKSIIVSGVNDTVRTADRAFTIKIDTGKSKDSAYAAMKSVSQSGWCFDND